VPENSEFLAQAMPVLQNCAFHVIVAHDFRELEAACDTLRFHVAVLGPRLGPKMKTAVALLLQEKCPQASVIELGDSPVLESAIHSSGERGADFLALVKAALARP
jgi:hypothetical protein